MTSSSRPPEGRNSSPSVTIDQFLGSLTAPEKELLTRYLALDPNDAAGQSLLIKQRGEAFTQLAYEVQKLVQEYGCGFAAIRQILLDRLEKEGFNLTFCPGANSTRESVSHLVDPYAPTEHSSSPPPHPNIRVTIDALQTLMPDQLMALDIFCMADHDTTDKTRVPVLPRIFLQVFDQLKERGLDLSAREARTMIHEAIVVIRSK